MEKAARGACGARGARNASGHFSRIEDFFPEIMNICRNFGLVWWFWLIKREMLRNGAKHPYLSYIWGWKLCRRRDNWTFLIFFQLWTRHGKSYVHKPEFWNFKYPFFFIYKNFSLKYNIKEHIPTRKGIDLNVDTLFWCFIYNVIRKLFKYTKCPQFPGKCLQSRFAGFAAFLMSAHNLERLNTVNISYTNISKCYLKYLNILISNCEFDFICKILSKIETDSLPYKSFGAQSPVVMWWYL